MLLLNGLERSLLSWLIRASQSGSRPQEYGAKARSLPLSIRASTDSDIVELAWISHSCWILLIIYRQRSGSIRFPSSFIRMLSTTYPFTASASIATSKSSLECLFG